MVELQWSGNREELLVWTVPRITQESVGVIITLGKLSFDRAKATNIWRRSKGGTTLTK